MTYREKLELYSQGKLDEQQKIEIERELEKQEALSDYLFEHQAPPGMDDFFDDASPFGAKASDTEEAAFEIKDDSEAITKQINSSIRKAFIKTGVIAAAAAITLTLFIVFALPHIVSAFYYDPGKSIGTDENGNAIEQFERDMSVYAEMFIPEMGPRISVGTDSYGYGNYSYYIDTRFGVGTEGQYENISHVYTGNMKRNSIVCYNYDELESFNKQESYFDMDAETAAGSLRNMNDTDLYYAYAALDRDVPYERFYADYVGNDAYGTNGSWVWCGVRVSDHETDNGHYNEGFFATAYQDRAEYDYDSSAYPQLAWEDGSKELDTEQKAAAHFESMASYLLDNEKFGSLNNHLNLKQDFWSLEDAETYVRENGINVYGFIYVGDKSHIEELAKAKGIRQVTVREAE